jgi:hypothetical protein
MGRGVGAQKLVPFHAGHKCALSAVEDAILAERLGGRYGLLSGDPVRAISARMVAEIFEVRELVS